VIDLEIVVTIPGGMVPVLISLGMVDPVIFGAPEVMDPVVVVVVEISFDRPVVDWGGLTPDVTALVVAKREVVIALEWPVVD